jgi:dTDP-4-dehydrorhamnose reductase
MAVKKKIFIVGISGQVGYALGCRLRKNYLISGACFSHLVFIPGAQIFPVAIDTVDLLESMIRMQAPDIIIYAAGINDPVTIEQSPKLSESLNVMLPVTIGSLAARLRAKFIFLGCASVFDGEKGNYREENTDFTLKDPLGKQKMAAYSFVRSQTLESTSFRLGRVLSPGHPYRPSLFDKIRFAAASGRQFTASKRKVRSYLSIHSMAQAMELVFSSEFPARHRLYHMGGVSMSEFDMAQTWFKLVGGDPKLVVTSDSDSHNDFSLDSNQLATQFPPWKPESKDELLLHLLEDLSPGMGVKKWQKTLQIP